MRVEFEAPALRWDEAAMRRARLAGWPSTTKTGCRWSRREVSEEGPEGVGVEAARLHLVPLYTNAPRWLTAGMPFLARRCPLVWTTKVRPHAAHFRSSRSSEKWRRPDASLGARAGVGPPRYRLISRPGASSPLITLRRDHFALEYHPPSAQAWRLPFESSRHQKQGTCLGRWGLGFLRPCS